MDTYYRSTEINLITSALSKAQGSYKKLVPNVMGHRGMYANLEATIDAVRDSLSTNLIAFWQHIDLLDEGSGSSLLRTTISHENQYLGSVARIVPGKTEAETGTIIEIHKRRQAQMLLGIAPSPNDPFSFDDDGKLQQEEFVVQQLIKPKEFRTPTGVYETITKEQYDDVNIELANDTTLAQQIRDRFQIESLQDIPKASYHEAIQEIRKIKQRVKEYQARKKS